VKRTIGTTAGLPAGRQLAIPERGNVDAGRREFLRKSFMSYLTFSAVPVISACSDSGSGVFEQIFEPPPASNIDNLGALGSPDQNGLRLPQGFTSRVVARSGEEPVPGSGYVWHDSPDGGAVFPVDDGGWVYTSNSEIFQPRGLGGAGALRFDSGGNLMSAYSILQNTSANCAGGPTPWGTWLSCEEYRDGMVWECDPLGGDAAIARPALGVFVHEAAGVHQDTGYLYMTEDQPRGRFYRFIPDRMDLNGNPDLTSGTLQVAEVTGGTEGRVVWHDVPDPSATVEQTSAQVPESTVFDGGEGLYMDGQIAYFTTKGDNRVWAYDTADENLFIIYDDNFFTNPVLTGVDNVTVSMGGDILVAEDGGNMQIVAISPTNRIVPLVEIVGQDGSELTGPAFTQAGDRLYFSSQRGEQGIFQGPGITYEVQGPFLT
jgi:sugar lactone lactonase YvrE